MQHAGKKPTASTRRAARDSMAMYFEVLRDAAPMDRETEHRVAERAHAHDADAIEQLVRANLRFVVTVAKRYQHMGLSFEDLIGEGNLGLVRAAERFDPSHGVRFATYAAWWIRHAILTALANQGAEVARPPQEVMAELRLKRRIEGVRQTLGREPTSRELSTMLDVDEGKVIARQEAWRTAVPLDHVRSGPEASARGIEVAAQPPEYSHHADDLRAQVDALLANLPPREERVLRLAFGLEADAPRTLAGIAAALGVSPQRVSALRDRALSRLRASLRGQATAS